MLYVDGNEIPYAEMHRYAIRWSSIDGPALYRDGSRVVKAWRLTGDIIVDAKPEEADANTAS